MEKEQRILINNFLRSLFQFLGECSAEGMQDDLHGLVDNAYYDRIDEIEEEREEEDYGQDD